MLVCVSVCLFVCVCVCVSVFVCVDMFVPVRFGSFVSPCIMQTTLWCIRVSEKCKVILKLEKWGALKIHSCTWVAVKCEKILNYGPETGAF